MLRMFSDWMTGLMTAI